MKLAWSRGRRASRATSIASFLGCCQGVNIIVRNYHSRSSVVRYDEAIKTLAETEEIWAKIRICRVAKTSEIRKQSFPGSARCRRRPGLLKLPIIKGTGRINPNFWGRTYPLLPRVRFRAWLRFRWELGTNCSKGDKRIGLGYSKPGLIRRWSLWAPSKVT